MALSLVNNSQQNDADGAAVRVLLLDTPENLGVDFLQSLQRQEMKLAFERVNDKEGLFSALKNGNWDILLVCDQVNVPGPEETLAYLTQLNCETGYVLLSKSELTIDLLTKSYSKGIAAVVSAEHPDFSLEVFAREAERSRRNFQLSLLNQEKFELKRLSQQLMSGTEEALAYLQDGIHIFGNDAYLKLLGYAGMDDLIVMPFIDIVSTEMREKTKQRLLDYQHKVRMQPDTPHLEIAELFVNGIGEKEGVLQVGATFKPVVYEGEDCIQVVFKISKEGENKEESSAAEGLGYTLFITHLDNFIAKAGETASHLGFVVHVFGTGFEKYIANKGFGSLNGKLKALASELKAGLEKEDLLIRFTESSFLILLKRVDSSKASGSAMLEKLGPLLEKFETALNKEIGSSTASKAITLSHDVVPVDANFVSADQLIQIFLTGKSGINKNEPKVVAEDNTANRIEPQRTEAASKTATAQQLDIPSDPIPAQATAPVPSEDSSVLSDIIPEPVNPDIIDQSRINAALNGNSLTLMHETVISVSEIVTEFHDINLYLPSVNGEGMELICRESLGENLINSALAAKLDQWTLHNTLAVIADLYNQGQEYPVILPMSARSLFNKRLAEVIRTELNSFGLPGAIIALDFSIDDISSDLSNSMSQLEKLKAEGITLCISNIFHVKEVVDMHKQAKIDMIRLQNNFVQEAASAESTFSLLQKSVAALQSLKIRVLAGGISNHNELSICCKAGIDLVKGKYIQKNPQVLNADSLADEMMV
jgi:multidomain signaling protein FimX